MKKTSEMTQKSITQEGKTESGNIAEVFSGSNDDVSCTCREERRILKRILKRYAEQREELKRVWL